MTAPLTNVKIPAATAPATATDPSPVRTTWQAIRAAVAEMNYATQRLAEPRITPR